MIYSIYVCTTSGKQTIVRRCLYYILFFKCTIASLYFISPLTLHRHGHVTKQLYSTGLRLGFASGKTQLLGFASGKNARNWRHLTQKIPTCWYPQSKSLASGLLPNANPRRQNFASQWNIGLRLLGYIYIYIYIFCLVTILQTKINHQYSKEGSLL